MQEQMSLTGVLLSQAFPLDDEAMLTDLLLDASRRGKGSNFRLSPAEGGGTWFRSRALQAQYLGAVRSSRSRVEVTPPSRPGSPQNPPVLLSTVEDPLRDVFYIDTAGAYWRVAQLDVGKRTSMVMSSREEYELEFMAQHVRTSGLRARGRIERIAGRRNHVYAVADEPPPERFISTHPSITWENKLLYMGPCLVVEGGQP